MIPDLRRALLLLPVLALAAAVSCGDDGTAPPPTRFEATLLSPTGDDGALLVELTGPVDEVTAPAADTLLVRTRAPFDGSRPDTTWVFVALRTPGALTFTVRTPALAGRPSVRILQVVGPDNELRENLDAYTLELEP